MSQLFIRYPSGGGGASGGGITSINGNTSPSQTIAAGTGISVSSTGGTTTISATGGSMAEYNNGTAGSSLTVNFTNGPAQTLTTSANLTLSFSNDSSGQAYVLRITSGGAYTITWPSNVKWGSLGVPSNSQTAGLNDLINLYFDGVTLYGSYVLGY